LAVQEAWYPNVEKTKRNDLRGDHFRLGSSKDGSGEDWKKRGSLHWGCNRNLSERAASNSGASHQPGVPWETDLKGDVSLLRNILAETNSTACIAFSKMRTGSVKKKAVSTSCKSFQVLEGESKITGYGMVRKNEE